MAARALALLVALCVIAPAAGAQTTTPAPAPGAAAPVGPTGATGTTGATGPATAAGSKRDEHRGLSGLALAAIVAGGVVVLALLAWALARWRAWQPPWMLRWRHAMGEAGWRTGNAWADFVDWLRLGR